MSYLIGIQNKKTRSATLISNFHWSKNDSSLFESSHAISTGLLFRGCIFGLTGDIREAKLFLNAFWNSSHRFTLSMEENWKAFNHFLSGYKAHTREGFSMLVSSRVSGIPQLYLYTSRDNTFTEVLDPIITLGNKKNAMDPVILKDYKETDKLIFSQCDDHLIPIQYYSYFICTWLMEASGRTSSLQNDPSENLYYFYNQTPLLEKRQDPALYGLKQAKNRELLYRISFVDNFLVYENLHEKQRKIIPFMNADFISPELIDVISSMSKNQMSYLFYGLANPRRKNSEPFTFSLVNEKIPAGFPKSRF